MGRDRTLVPVLVGAAAFNREPLECVCFVADMTLRKQAEAAAERARAAAERAIAEKTRVLAAASHDLRQPLQGLAALLTLLGSRSLEPEDASLVARADRAIRSLAELLNVLLDFSQLDAGLIEPQVQDFPVERLLDTMRDEFESVAGERGLRFRVNECEAWIRSDPALLGRIIRNLVSNATKYTPEGGEVRIDCRRADEVIVIEVAGTGIGIPPEMHQAIFEDFRQLDNPERDFRKGLGLGLSIVARMAELLKHTVTVCSAPRKGSVFRVTVPSATARPPEMTEATQPGGGQRILFVEDNELVAEVMAELLSDQGHAVACVASAEQAIAAVAEAEEAFDTVISDFRLPSLSGLDVIEAARERWPRANAILVTGDTFDQKLQGLPSVGIRLLRKPVRSEELMEALSSAGSGHG